MARSDKPSRENALKKEMERALRRGRRPKTEQEMYEQALGQIPSDLLAGRIRGRHVVDKPLEEFAMDAVNYYPNDPQINAEYGADLGNDTYVAPVPGEAGPGGNLIYGPSSFGKDDDTEVPTSTTNPDRPRTLAASYDGERQVLTVMFRDGTVYNYYEVSREEWELFHSETSKGEVIAAFLDGKPRGPADLTDFPEEIKQQVFLLSSSQQRAKFKSNKEFTRQQTKRMKKAMQSHPRNWIPEDWDTSAYD